MSKNVTRLSNILMVLDDKYVLNFHKINLLSMAEESWQVGDSVRVTDLLKTYKGASPATTHKAINELIAAKFFKVVSNKEDKREKILEEGLKFKHMEADLEKLL